MSNSRSGNKFFQITSEEKNMEYSRSYANCNDIVISETHKASVSSRSVTIFRFSVSRRFIGVVTTVITATGATFMVMVNQDINLEKVLEDLLWRSLENIHLLQHLDLIKYHKTL